MESTPGSVSGFSQVPPRGDSPARGFRRPEPDAPPAIDYGALVDYVVQSIADQPEEAQVTVLDRGRGTLAVKVKMADSDVGRLIGKQGRNIEALRTLVRVASLREHRRVFVDLADQK